MNGGETSYEVRRLESWGEFLDVITDSRYSDWAFRGHPKEQWPLLSALSRYLMNFRVDPPVWAAQEERILRIFKRKGHHFLSGRPLPDDDFEWLALMQHHGAPTRLLDFTWSPYVAAFFALQLATGDAAVWALSDDLMRGSRRAAALRAQGHHDHAGADAGRARRHHRLAADSVDPAAADLARVLAVTTPRRPVNRWSRYGA